MLNIKRIYDCSFYIFDMVSVPDYAQLRDEFIAYIHDEEHSDGNTKYFRIIQYLDSSTSTNTNVLTISAKTKLGAIITYMDWDIKQTVTNNYWLPLVKERSKYKNVETFASDLIERMIDGCDDDSVLTEIGVPISLNFLE